MKKLAILACALALTVSTQVQAQQNAVGNNANPTSPPGMRILGSDGTYDRAPLYDANGRQEINGPYGLADVLQHRTNVSINAAANDSSAIPLDTRGYRQLYVLIRSKAATFGAAPISLQLAVRSVAQAAYDSTAAGWWYPMGKGAKYGKTLPMVDLNDRWKMIPLADSIAQIPFVSPYTGIYTTNLTGATWVGDIWVLGVR